MGYAPGDIGHLAKHDTIDTQLNAALNDLAGRLSDTSLAAAYVEHDTLTFLAPRATGADQSAALSAALATAAASGMWLQLNGDHIVSNAVTVPSGARIDGATGTIRQSGTLKNVFRITGQSNIRFKNMNAYGKTSDYLNTSGVYQAAAVYIVGASSDIRIDNCKLLGFAGAGVFIDGAASDVHVADTKITGPGATYITSTTFNFSGGVVSFNGAENCSVTDCDISGFSQGVVTGYGSHWSVRGNHIHDIPGQHGMYFGPISDIIISGNIVRDCAILGMKMQIADDAYPDSVNVIIADNVWRNVGAQGILLSNIQTPYTPKFRNVSITGNVVNGAGLAGIEVNNTVGLHIADNFVASAQSGIKIDTCSAVTSAGNHLMTFTRSGLIIASSTDVVVDGARIMDPGSGAVPTDRFGILINGTSADVTIRGVKITDTTTNMVYAVYVAAGDSTTMDFIDIVGIGATAYGWRLQTSGAVRTMRGCTFAGTTGAMTTPPTNYVQNADTSGATLTALETEVNELKAVLRSAGLIRT